MIVTKNVTAGGQWTNIITPLFNPPIHKISLVGRLNISIKGTWSATVSLKRKLPGLGSFEEVDTFTSNIQTYLIEVEEATEYIIGVESGNFNSGTIELRLSR